MTIVQVSAKMVVVGLQYLMLESGDSPTRAVEDADKIKQSLPRDNPSEAFSLLPQYSAITLLICFLFCNAGCL